jgi:hypothetical protein
MKSRSGGGLLLLRRKTPLTRRSVAYFHSGAHTRHREVTINPDYGQWGQGSSMPTLAVHCREISERGQTAFR